MSKYETVLEVRLAPQILSSQPHIIAHSGDNVSLPCISIGIPDPVVVWRKETEEIFYVKDYSIIKRDGTLQFPAILVIFHTLYYKHLIYINFKYIISSINCNLITF